MVEAKATCLDLKRWSSKDTCIHDQQSLNRVGFFNPNHINQFLVSVLVICQRRGISARPTNADNGSTKSPCSSWTRLSQREGDAKKESYEMLAWPRSSSGGSIFVVWHLKIQCHSVTCCSPTPPPKLTGFPWHLLASTAVASQQLETAAVTGPRWTAAYTARPWKPSLLSSSTATPQSRRVEGKHYRTARWEDSRKGRDQGVEVVPGHHRYSQRKLQFKPSELSGNLTMFVCVCSGVCFLVES